MTLKGITKNAVNRVLRYANARVESLTLDKLEEQRLGAVVSTGYFDHPIFPVPNSFLRMNCDELLREVETHQSRMRELAQPPRDAGAYSLENGYFTSPDAEVLYAIVHHHKPSRIVEVGSGNSTKLMRVAVRDAGLTTHISSIDPIPRTDIDGVSDFILRQAVECLEPEQIAGQLAPNDILFIDSSHTARPCGDVAFLFLRVLPLLAKGVIVHVHDFFAPYDYPKEWIVDFHWPWNEQYLVQAILSFGNAFEVLWAGHYLQRTRSDFDRYFPLRQGRRASSLWLQKT